MSTAGVRESALSTIARGQIGYKELIRQVGAQKPALDAALVGLRREGLIESTVMGYRLAPRRVPDAEAAADIRGEHPVQKQRIEATAAPQPPEPAPPPEFLCSKCRQAKFDREMYRRGGNRLSICKACYQAAIREGRARQAERDAAIAHTDLRQLVRKHTKKPGKAPLHVRHSRELTAEINELDVFITVREDDQASGAVTLTYAEAAGLRDWLNAQQLG
jgi:hypothetical protein